MLKSGLPPVSTAMALKFLMARKFDVTRASKLFKRHLEVRVKYKMAEMKPLDEPLSKELLSEKLTILDRVEANKPAVILVNGKYYKPEEKDHLFLIQSLIFQLDEALRDSSTQRNGLILIYNMTDSGRENFNYKLSIEILNLLKDAYPARLKKILIISAPLWFKISFKVISTFLNEKIRDRVEFADVGDIQQHLEQECIPKNLGGMWDVNHSLWMSRCMDSYAEGNCDEPCFQLTAPVLISGRKTIDIPKQPTSHQPTSQQPKKLPDINVPPAESSRISTSRNGAPVDGMTVQQLLAHMKKQGSGGIKREFESLAKYDRKASYDVFKSPYNRPKNRYIDVICLDQSRVNIPPVSGDESTDYIHANFVDGYHGKNTYIGAQGPLPATFRDFWRMIWTTGTVVIVMLTK
ncbi:tyrosine- phosphatase non-receptor type 9 [Paramuricea clavata]|nr:tyrosine- phosphatase non-receptor type 9 [Paramuricea clavata]